MQLLRFDTIKISRPHTLTAQHHITFLPTNLFPLLHNDHFITSLPSLNLWTCPFPLSQVPDPKTGSKSSLGIPSIPPLNLQTYNCRNLHLFSYSIILFFMSIIGLPKKFIQVFPKDVMENLKRTFWPTPYFAVMHRSLCWMKMEAAPCCLARSYSSWD